jgi:putative two-component system response regulator
MNRAPWLGDGELASSSVFAQALPSMLGEGRTPLSGGARLNGLPGSSLMSASLADLRRHAARSAGFSGAVGRRLSLTAKELRRLRLGSLLHDIGKLAVPLQVLLKCGRLSPEEFAAVKLHPVIGDLLCAGVPGLHGVRAIVRHHHERLDGTGYPDGLAGERIPLLAQIVGTVDVYDALICPRPYKPAFDREHAFDILHREVEAGWRAPELVDTLMEVVVSGEVDHLDSL